MISRQLSIAMHEAHRLEAVSTLGNAPEALELKRRWNWEVERLSLALNYLQDGTERIALLPLRPQPCASVTPCDEEADQTRFGSTLDTTSSATSCYSSPLAATPSAFVNVNNVLPLPILSESINEGGSMRLHEPPPPPPLKSITSNVSSLMALVDHDLRRMGIVRPLPIVRQLPLVIVRRLKMHARRAKARLREQRAIDRYERSLLQRAGRLLFEAGRRHLRASALQRVFALRSSVRLWRSNVSGCLLLRSQGHSVLRRVKRYVLLKRIFDGWWLSVRVTHVFFSAAGCSPPSEASVVAVENSSDTPPHSVEASCSVLCRFEQLSIIDGDICTRASAHPHMAVYHHQLPANVFRTSFAQNAPRNEHRFSSRLLQSALASLMKEELERLCWRLPVVKSFRAWRCEFTPVRRYHRKLKQTAAAFHQRSRLCLVLRRWRGERIVRALQCARHARQITASFRGWRVVALTHASEIRRLREFVDGSAARHRRLLFARWRRVTPVADESSCVEEIACRMTAMSFLALYAILSTWTVAREVDAIVLAEGSMSSRKARNFFSALTQWDGWEQQEPAWTVSPKMRSALLPCNDDERTQQAPRRDYVEIAKHLAQFPELLSELSLDTQWLHSRMLHVVCFMRWRALARFHRVLVQVLTTTRLGSRHTSGTNVAGRKKSFLATAAYQILEERFLGKCVDPSWWGTADRSGQRHLRRRSSTTSISATGGDDCGARRESTAACHQPTAISDEVLQWEEASLAAQQDSSNHAHDSNERNEQAELFRLHQLATMRAVLLNEDRQDEFGRNLPPLIVQLVMLLAPMVPSSSAEQIDGNNINHNYAEPATLTASPALCCLLEACVGRRNNSVAQSTVGVTAIAVTATHVKEWVAMIESQYPGATEAHIGFDTRRLQVKTSSGNDDVAPPDVAGTAESRFSSFLSSSSADDQSAPLPLTRGEQLALQRATDIHKIGAVNCRLAAARYATEPPNATSLLGFLSSEVTMNVQQMFAKKKKKTKRHTGDANPAKPPKQVAVVVKEGQKDYPTSAITFAHDDERGDVEGATSSPSGFHQLPPAKTAYQTTVLVQEPTGSRQRASSNAQRSSSSSAAATTPLYGDVIAVSTVGSTAARTLLRVPSDDAIGVVSVSPSPLVVQDVPFAETTPIEGEVLSVADGTRSTSGPCHAAVHDVRTPSPGPFTLNDPMEQLLVEEAARTTLSADVYFGCERSPPEGEGVLSPILGLLGEAAEGTFPSTAIEQEGDAYSFPPESPDLRSAEVKPATVRDTPTSPTTLGPVSPFPTEAPHQVTAAMGPVRLPSVSMDIPTQPSDLPTSRAQQRTCGDDVVIGDDQDTSSDAALSSRFFMPPNSLRSLQTFSWDHRMGTSSSSGVPRHIRSGSNRQLRRPTSAFESRSTASTELNPRSALKSGTLFGASSSIGSALPTAGFPAQTLRKQKRKTR